MRICYRPLTPEDIPQLIEIFSRVHPTIFGLSETKVYQALLMEAASSAAVHCLVAQSDRQLVGFIVATVNWSRFKQIFVLKHPLIGFKVLIKKVLQACRNLASPRNTQSHFPVPSYGNITSGQVKDYRGEQVAFVIIFGVDPAYRRMRIGTGLWRSLQEYLMEKGIKRIECHVDKNNPAPLLILERLGWTVIDNPTEKFGFVTFSEHNDPVALDQNK